MVIRTLLPNYESGFTIVETIITLIVLNLFVIMIVQSYLVMESQRLLVSQGAIASDVANSNLRKFTTRPANLTAAQCDASMQNGGTGKLLGNQTNTTTTSAYGFLAEPSSTTQTLGTNSTQEVRA